MHHLKRFFRSVISAISDSGVFLISALMLVAILAWLSEPVSLIALMIELDLAPEGTAEEVVAALPQMRRAAFAASIVPCLIAAMLFGIVSLFVRLMAQTSARLAAGYVLEDLRRERDAARLKNERPPPPS